MSGLRDQIAEALAAAMREHGDLDIAQHFADVAMSIVGPIVDRQSEVVARAVVLAAGVNPRDLRRARRGMHRRMYVPADRLISLIEALDEGYPGSIAEIRSAEEESR